ncbi:MAG: serine protease [Syntrophomonadaceae bacterium]
MDENNHQVGNDLVPDQENEYGEDEIKRPRKRGFFLKISAVLVLLAFIVSSAPELAYIFNNRLGFLEQNKVLRNDQIVQICRPAVVSIEAVDTSNPVKTATHRGTGFNLDSSGIVITNLHIVTGSANITVTFEDGQKFYINHYDPVPGHDLVIIRLNSAGLPAIEINWGQPSQAGDTVTVIGNPLGFQKIAQRGKVAGYIRNESDDRIMAIQLPINPGNSGSPVIDEQAQVVGIIYGSSSQENNGAEEPLALAIPAAVLEGQI